MQTYSNEKFRHFWFLRGMKVDQTAGSGTLWSLDNWPEDQSVGRLVHSGLQKFCWKKKHILLNLTAGGEYKIARFIILTFYTSLYQKLNGTEVEYLFLLKQGSRLVM